MNPLERTILDIMNLLERAQTQAEMCEDTVVRGKVIQAREMLE
jgi:hypothetical protein